MKVLIVDDDALIRDSLKLLLELERDFQVVGMAANGQEAFEMCRREMPDIVLMDIYMPIMDGVLGTKLIKSQFQDIQIVILTVFKDGKYIKEAIQNGAAGYILKSQSAESIMESLRAVSKGNMVLENDVAQSISAMLTKEKEKDPRVLTLTKREMEILRLVGEGLSNKEIASQLFLSEGTVRNYVTYLLEKLSLRDRTQLAIFFVKNFYLNELS